jgi:hypothetical protein
MIKSQLFFSDAYLEAQEKIRSFLNAQGDFLSESTANSTRAVGDAIQDVLADEFDQLLGPEHCTEYSSQFARRAMADLAFKDKDDLYYIVDVKTHRLSTKFNMPNLTSVDRLARYYEDDSNYFVVLMVAYDMEGTKAVIESVRFVPIEFVGWDCLTIGALGWGQIQIANSNVITINDRFSRREWMLQLCDALFEFYPKEIAKIDKRIARFKNVRERWEKHPG